MMWFRRGRKHATVRGERHGSAKLCEAQVREIRARYQPGVLSQRQLGQEYGVGHALIWKILARRVWRHLEG